MELFVLETERLRLRPLTLDDAEQLHQLFDIEPDVWKVQWNIEGCSNINPPRTV